MMLLTLTFDSLDINVREVAEIEERIWNGLKLSGEYNRTLKDDQWVIHFVIEKKVREETLMKIPGVEKAKSLSLRDHAEENNRSKRKTALVAADAPVEEDSSPDEEED